MQEHDPRERQKKQKAETQKLKVHKDFGFLLTIKPVFINSKTAKYLLQQGIEEPVGQYKEDAFEAYVSYFKYDYDGKTIEKVSSAKFASDKGDDLRDAVLSMRIKEKAWFNVCDYAIHKIQYKVEVIEDGLITEDADGNEENETQQKKELERTGFHYEMTLQRIQFRNADKIEIKRKIYEQSREKGKELFKQEKYYEASKVYKYVTHISENLAKNSNYTAEEKGELESINNHAKLNYIKCFFKIKEDWVQRDMQDFVKQTIDLLLKKKPHANTTHFYNAKWLLRERLLDNALEAAKKSNAIQRDPATEKLIAEILSEKQNKGKIKVAVKS